MSQAIYRKLAAQLDALPNGFPATRSGVELRLLAKMFKPEEAALAAVMREAFEPAADIATRAGVDAKAAYRTLKGMAKKGLIFAGRGPARKLAFALMPFVVGFYEEQLPRMDEDMALLFEAYYQETRGGGVAMEGGAVHRVIPVEQAISFSVTVYPYERATALIESAKSWGVRDCICRVQTRLAGRGCEHEIENCIVFAPVKNLFKPNHPTIRPIDKEEALHILHESEEAGLVHTAGNYRDEHHYICNCCTCSCGVMRSVVEFDLPNAIAQSAFYAIVDPDQCAACEECLDRCQFQALSIDDGVCIVDKVRCVGCGVCAAACMTGAIGLARRPDVEAPPKTIEEWKSQRAEARGLDRLK